MFDMQKIGRQISEKRRRLNMTQMELADRLNISFQAVSAWERGQSMPDISKLGELSEILETSIDALLGNERYATLIKAIAGQEPLDGSAAAPLSASELAQIAPILKPNQMEMVVKDALNRETNDAVSYAKGVARQEIKKALSREAQNDEYIASVGLYDMVQLFPYLSDERLNELAWDCYNAGGIRAVSATLAPFLYEEKITELIDKAIEDGASLEDMIELFPHAESGVLGRAALSHMERYGTLDGVGDIFPFLEDDMNDEIAKIILRKKRE